jgi:DNA polymerase III sliding clamp (beta) subunit (PCNA family)
MITIQQDTLNAALSAVTRASARSTLMTAFSLVRLDASLDGSLALFCFNGETAARAILYAACEEELSVCVDAQTLRDVTETLAGEIRLEVENNNLLLHSGSNRTTLWIVDEKFPIIGGENTQTLTTLPGNILRSLTRVIPFAADDSRPSLNVLHLALSKEQAIARGADGFTAGQVLESIQGPGEEQAISLPLSFARTLTALVEDGDTVQIQTSGPNRFLFELTNSDSARHLTLATVTASAESFPAAQIGEMIESARKDAIATLRASGHSLAQTIRMVSAMQAQNAFIKATNGVIKMASAETEVGQARNILEGTASGLDAHVWLSAAFLKRASDACKGEITLRISEEKKPVLLEEGSFTGLIMPILSDGAKDPFQDKDEAIPLVMPEMAIPA